MVDPDRLATLLAHRRLLSLLGSRMRDLAPDPLAAAIEASLSRDRAAALALAHWAGQAQTALRTAGLRAVALKGP
ncbi:MAG: hypothetical protein H0V81_06745, partial [Solirubrobacterales bacterium]|nr:hypothetical protein [Solirubrobacterales bacterium]